MSQGSHVSHRQAQSTQRCLLRARRLCGESPGLFTGVKCDVCTAHRHLDFFVVPTIDFKLMFVFLVRAHERRRVI